jgi:hypothetical protein
MTSISLFYLEEVDIPSLCGPVCRVSFQGVAVLGPFAEYVSLTEPEGCGHVGGYRNRLRLISHNLMDKGVVVHLGFNELASFFIGKSTSSDVRLMC